MSTRDATPIYRAIPPDAPSPQFLPAGTRLLDYQIEKVLGHGGFGITYLARDTHLNKPLAIKEYLPAALALRSGAQVTVRTPAQQDAFNWGLRQFLKEAQTLARFAHANLVPVYRFFEANQTAYIVMAYAEGETMASVLKREPALNEEQLRGVLLPVMDGLEVVHGDGVLHRDIKPDNIIIRQDDSPVLIDFGAARFNLGSASRTVMRAVSAGYAPLEQYGESAGQGPWTDIYALGALAYRVISGRKPSEAINRVHDDPLVPAEELGNGRYSAAFLAAVDWALAMNAQERPRDIAELRQALNGTLTRAQRPAARPRVRRGPMSSVVATALLAVGFGLQPVLSPPVQPQDPPPQQAQAAHVYKGLEMAYVLTGPYVLAKPPSPATPEISKVAAVVDGVQPDPRAMVIEEQLPIHRRR